MPSHDLTDPAFYGHYTDERVRFSDTDLIGHVNNVAHVALVESGRIAYVRAVAQQAGLGIESIMFARLEIDFRADLFYPEAVRVGARTVAIGRSSFRVAVGVFVDDRCITTSINVMVHLGADRRPDPVVDPFRALLIAEIPAGGTT